MKIENTEHIKFSIPKTGNNGFLFTIDVVIESYLEKYLEAVEIGDSSVDEQIIKMRHKLKIK
ncbi:hypothetical protein GCM10007103_21200 [Salinimicrobium marinum]|uniref:Uncharacterized protein n=1 Tax=Salinimicrobium marinum TaxID=680283 RepID=A0A918SF07_9FLAO|nr:hypothetical protein [Salinimicrobium marinum]GHA39593.1 hypothetical protein GCM10007103_21200 [Salinimicrobium marinum]